MERGGGEEEEICEAEVSQSVTGIIRSTLTLVMVRFRRAATACDDDNDDCK